MRHPVRLLTDERRILQKPGVVFETEPETLNQSREAPLLSVAVGRHAEFYKVIMDNSSRRGPLSIFAGCRRRGAA